MDEFLIAEINRNPNGCTTQWISVMAFTWKYWHNYRQNYDSWSDLKKDLGRLPIEKKIDHTREGLWVPIYRK